MLHVSEYRNPYQRIVVHSGNLSIIFRDGPVEFQMNRAFRADYIPAAIRV